ncbi:JmjC domain, hydroxylase-domain-containing protein [Globomyces pollinis-pini]|nr:JmjC domain, hydroxylase-domain-containing protein [Globomyces pollinis-pini]
MIIRPAYYFETSGVPVFQPTYEEFKDFYTFIQSVEKYGMKAGLIKVIPPQEWLDSNKASPELIKKFTIKKPIKQVFNCGGLPAGAHRQLNMETKKSYTIQDWFDITETDFKPPIMTDLGKMVLPAQIKKRKHKAVQEDENITSKKTALEPSVEDKSSGNEINMENHDIVPISEIPDVPIVKEEYLTQNPAFISKFASKPSLEYLAALERFYWRNLSFQPTMYGADLLGTLFQENPDNKWNVAHLENLLSKVAINVPGVTKPYLYFGMYKATFAWHVEDMDLFSINYIHFGAPKQWYVIPPAHRSRFERFAKGTFFNEAHECPDFLRHKNCVISPSVVSAQNIPVHKLVQFANEFVITFPSGTRFFF